LRRITHQPSIMDRHARLAARQRRRPGSKASLSEDVASKKKEAPGEIQIGLCSNDGGSTFDRSVDVVTVLSATVATAANKTILHKANFLQTSQQDENTPLIDDTEGKEDVAELEKDLRVALGRITPVAAKKPALLRIIKNDEKTGPKATALKEHAMYALVQIYCEVKGEQGLLDDVVDCGKHLLARPLDDGNNTNDPASSNKLINTILDIIAQSKVRSTLEKETAKQRILLLVAVETKTNNEQKISSSPPCSSLQDHPPQENPPPRQDPPGMKDDCSQSSHETANEEEEVE
jgi:hypothetical protein